MLNHYARIVEPYLALPAAAVADTAFAAAVATATNTDAALLRRGTPGRHLEQFLNRISLGGSGCTSLADLLDAHYLGSITDTMESLTAFTTTAPILASHFSDPSTWASCSISTLGSAATAWDHLTSLPQFHDLAVTDNIRDLPIYRALTGASTADIQASVLTPPLISNLSAIAGKQPQRAFSTVLLRAAFSQLVDRPSVPTAVRCRVRQAAVYGAGRFQVARPLPGSGRPRLSDDDFLPNWWFRYGLPLLPLRGKCCTDRCSLYGPHSTFSQSDFETGAHSLGCTAAFNYVWRRHESCLLGIEQWIEDNVHGATCNRTMLLVNSPMAAASIRCSIIPVAIAPSVLALMSPLLMCSHRRTSPRRSVFDLSLSGRPGASKAEGGGEKTKTRKQRGPGGPALRIRPRREKNPDLDHEIS